MNEGGWVSDIKPYLLPIITLFNGWLVYLVHIVRQDKKDLQGKVEQIDKRLTDFQLMASKEYVTVSSMRMMEDKLLTAINRIGERIDKVMDEKR